MSKTIEIQVEKTLTLVDGLRKNMGEVQGLGVNPSAIDEMEKKAREVQEASREIDAIREDLGRKVKAMNAVLSEMKEAFIDNKNIVKRHFDQPQWMRFGVQDKR